MSTDARSPKVTHMHAPYAYAHTRAARLTGLSEHQLLRWQAAGIFLPALAQGGDERGYGPIYSFDDIVSLRVLKLLHECVPDAALRAVGEWLKQHDRESRRRWRLVVSGGRVQIIEASHPAPGASAPNLTIDLAAVEEEMADAARRQAKRDPATIGKVSRHPEIMGNDWVIDGTRMPVWAIKDFHDSGWDDDRIIDEFPFLTRDDIRAALEFETRRQRRHAS